MYVDLSKIPNAPRQYQAYIKDLSGGLNLRKAPSEIADNQCSDMVNMLWENGVLRSRKGQEVLPASEGWDTNGNRPVAIFDRPWHGYLFMAFAGANHELLIAVYNIASCKYDTIYAREDLSRPVAEEGGSFFRFSEKLYFKGRDVYVEFAFDGATQTVSATDVVPYCPIIQINTNKNGVGNLYQPENRICAEKEIWYDLDDALEYAEIECDGVTKVFHLPHKKAAQPQDGDLKDLIQVYIGANLAVDGTDYEVNLTEGTITTLAEDAPSIGLKLTVTMRLYSFIYRLPVDSIDTVDGEPQIQVWVKNLSTGEYDQYSLTTADLRPDEFMYSNGSVIFDPTQNVGGDNAYRYDANVRSQFIKVRYKKENIKAQKAIDDCHIAIPYGATGVDANCIVMAGSEAQPNAFFWSGNDENGSNPAYFPIEQYNLVGEYSEAITAFGRQQDRLVIFQENRISAATYSFASVNDRLVVSLNTKTINDRIGCDRPLSVQLVENNLVWCHSKHGVMYLKDSTYAYESLVVGISGNINKALLGTEGLRNSVCSFDDGNRYWLCLDNGKCFVWDYSIRGYTSDTEKLSWFFMDNVHSAGWAVNGKKVYGLAPSNLGAPGEENYLFQFSARSGFTDFGAEMIRRVALKTQTFGTQLFPKNVNKMIVALPSDLLSQAIISYTTDVDDERQDATDINTQYETDSEQDPKPVAIRIRKPKCLRVQQFTVKFTNSLRSDMALLSVQIFYTCRSNAKAELRM